MNHKSMSPFKDGVKSALPIVLGYLPVALTFGMLARQAGILGFEWNNID